MSEHKLQPIPVYQGCEWYHLHRNRDGSIHTILFRPIRGPWTEALIRRVPTVRRGRVKDREEPIPAPAADPRPSRARRQGIVRAELKARQGALDV